LQNIEQPSEVFLKGGKMAITFHCGHCGKKIEAPDSAGGKWGKCPSCHNKVYVPPKEVYD
jgi:DNA-directed RNA polymerase subunit RPC12/RpoP